MMQDDGKMMEINDLMAQQLKDKTEMMQTSEGNSDKNGNPVFRVGDPFELKGRWFRVKSFMNGMLVLQGMPKDWEPSV